jgi:HAD superfamily hydrolase (TIGR01509 family)
VSPELVIFDCDGVLIDSEPLAVRADLACLVEAGIGITAEEIVERYTGISIEAMWADIEVRHGWRLPADLSERHHVRLMEMFEAELRPMPHIEATLDSLSCKVCVASSSSPERLRRGLSLVGLHDRFAPYVFSAAMVARGKPAPDLFLHAARRMGAAPALCVVVEDSPAGVTAAVAAGMTAIGFCGGSHCRPGHGAVLEARGGAAVIADLRDLADAIVRCRRRAGLSAS